MASSNCLYKSVPGGGSSTNSVVAGSERRKSASANKRQDGWGGKRRWWSGYLRDLKRAPLAMTPAALASGRLARISRRYLAAGDMGPSTWTSMRARSGCVTARATALGPSASTSRPRHCCLGQPDRRRELGPGARAPVFCTLQGGRLDSSYVRRLLPRLTAPAGRSGVEERA